MNVCLLILTNYRKERRLGKMGFRASERQTPGNVHQVHYVHPNVHWRSVHCRDASRHFAPYPFKRNELTRKRGSDYASDYTSAADRCLFDIISRVAL